MTKLSTSSAQGPLKIERLISNFIVIFWDIIKKWGTATNCTTIKYIYKIKLIRGRQDNSRTRITELNTVRRVT